MAKKHISDFNHCDYCQRVMEGIKGPEYCEQEFDKHFRKLHNAAIRRAERDQVIRDMGLVKVRGALGGTYWE